MSNQHERTYFGLQHTSLVIPAGQRPRCQACDKTLRLDTMLVHPGSNVPYVQNVFGETLEAAKAWAVCSNQNGEPETMKLWLGKFEGYGYDEDELPLFCSTRCGLRFARIMYLAGHRLALEGTTLTR